MSNLSEQDASKQLEELKDKLLLEIKRSSIEGKDRKEDQELVRLIFANLSMKESSKDLEVIELMLEESEIWNQADSLEIMKFFIQELLRRKDILTYEMAKKTLCLLRCV